MAATMTTALCAAVPSRVDRARGSRHAGPRPRARDAPSRVTWSGGRLALSAPRRGTTASAFGDPDRGSPRWSAPPRGPYRDARVGGANEPHRVPRAVLRELDGRENRTGAVPHPVLRAKKAAEEASVFERSGGFVYIRNFFSQRDYDLIRRECASLRTEVGSERRACARQRLGVMVSPEHVVHRAFMNRKVADRLGALTGESALLPADVPVEFRVYPAGSCMDWHQDVALYVEPQYELVFTLENSSDSQTQWQDEQGRRRGGWTEPNSVLMVRAEHVVHRVTPVTRGERSIVKFVYTTTLDKTDEFYDNLTTYER